jgi:hypothetical protein
MTINRYHAFGIHLTAAIAVALTIAFLVFKLWYPTPLAEAERATDIFLVLLGVDVILGPALTLVVFNPAKKELKRDLAIIVVVQIAALMYGMYTVFSTRPVFMVYSAGRFDLVFANDLDEERLSQATIPAFKSLPILGIETVGTLRTDTDARIRNKVPYGYPAALNDLPLLPKYYVPYQDIKANVTQALLPLADLWKLNPDNAGELANLKDSYGDFSDYGYLPLKGSLKDLTVVIKKTTGDIVEIKLLTPWKGL